jgi:hypothetical protein
MGPPGASNAERDAICNPVYGCPSHDACHGNSLAGRRGRAVGVGNPTARTTSYGNPDYANPATPGPLREMLLHDVERAETFKVSRAQPVALERSIAVTSRSVQTSTGSGLERQCSKKRRSTTFSRSW